MAIQKIKLDLGTVYQKEEGGVYYFRSNTPVEPGTHAEYA